MKKENILIIGAGLSGLYTAYLLQKEFNVTVIEARERVGGRVLSVEGHDMGPSWLWEHQKEIRSLIRHFGLELFEQYSEGLALYDSPEGVEKFSPPSTGKSYRIRGGITALLSKIATSLVQRVHISEKVLSLKEEEGFVAVETNKALYHVKRVISTLPPRLAVKSIVYEPALRPSVQRHLASIPTWMGYASKCVIEYPSAFWKEEGLSGFTFSHVGPLSEVHDATTLEKSALFGFVQGRAEKDTLEENILAQMVRLYGLQAAKPLNVYCVDWTEEVYTSTKEDRQALSAHPNYGFDLDHFNGKLLFSGTESSRQEGGYLEGALISAIEVSRKIINGEF